MTDRTIPMEEGSGYEIIKFYQGRGPKVQRRYGKMSLAMARQICSDPKTRGKNWFLGFSKAGNY